MASTVSARQPWRTQRGCARTEKSCGPDARGLCVKACGDAAARPGTRISHPQGDGGNSASLPGESTKDTVKTIRAGKAGMSRRHLSSTPCAFSSTRGTSGASRRPAFPAPFALAKGGRRQQNSGEPRRDDEQPCLLPNCGLVPRTHAAPPAMRSPDFQMQTSPRPCRRGRRLDRGREKGRSTRPTLPPSCAPARPCTTRTPPRLPWQSRAAAACARNRPSRSAISQARSAGSPWSS